MEESNLKSKINLENAIINFTKRYPDHILTQIFLNEGHSIDLEELIGAVGVWLAVCDLERTKNENYQRKIGGF